MGQGSVRVAIKDAIENANLTYVGRVHGARTYISEQDYEQNAMLAYTESINGSGCVIVVNLPGPDKRMRMTETGRGYHDDTNVHNIVLELFFACTSGDPYDAQTDYDTVVDALVPFIRDNPTMSAPETVWSAGEYKSGVVHHQSQPFTAEDGGTVFIKGTVTFDCWEWIAGNNS